MRAAVVWRSELAFEGSADSGFTLPLDAGPSHGGRGDGFRPMELLALGLAGCTGMDVLSILRKKRQRVSGFEVRVLARSAADHPKIFAEMALHYVVRGPGLDRAAVDRAIELSITKYCPAHAMLARAAVIRHTVEVLEEAGDGPSGDAAP